MNAAASPAQDERAQTRLALAALLVPIFFVIGFAPRIMGAYHKPHPNGIKVGVVGPAGRTAALRARLEQAAGSAFRHQRRTVARCRGRRRPAPAPERGLRADGGSVWLIFVLTGLLDRLPDSVRLGRLDARGA